MRCICGHSQADPLDKTRARLADVRAERRDLARRLGELAAQEEALELELAVHSHLSPGTEQVPESDSNNT